MGSDEPSRCEFEEEKLVLRFRTTIQADVNAISPVVEHVMETAARMGCIAGKELEVETALREALANAIVHGCKKDACKQVELCVACDEDRGMLIVVRDPGEGFDPTKIANPTVGQNIFQSHGRGIYLISQLMDEVRLQRGGTEIHMLKK
ncbi:MAG TPA: ATP-binding protein [Terriglobia bacterium]|nr:ATP-binding protein [Terriglobia bacterium]